MMDDRKPAYLSSRWSGPGTPRLLLVDDDEVMRRSSVRFLSRAGFEVVSAESGRDAIALLRANEAIDVAVIDLEMPEMDGVEVMRAILAERPELPMGLWSASQRLDELTPEELAPAWFVIHKMRPIGELVQAVCCAVYGHRSPRDVEDGSPDPAANGTPRAAGGGGLTARPPMESGWHRRRSVLDDIEEVIRGSSTR